MALYDEQNGMNAGGTWASMPSGGTMEPLKGMPTPGNGRAYTQNTQSTPPESGGFLDDLFGVGKGIYDARQNKDYSNNMKQFYGDALARQDPIRQRLMESYTNPNSFYDSNQWKGLESVYQNSIDRGAAKGGTLANPTAREALLQSYAMKELGNYRQGLTDQMRALDPSKYAEQWSKGSEAERMANMPVGSAAQNLLRSAGGIEGIMKLAQQIPGGLQTLMQKIPGLAGIFGGFEPNVDGQGDYGQNIPMGDPGFESDYPMSDPYGMGDQGGYAPPQDFGGYDQYDEYGGNYNPVQFEPEMVDAFGGDMDVENWFDYGDFGF